MDFYNNTRKYWLTLIVIYQISFCHSVLAAKRDVFIDDHYEQASFSFQDDFKTLGEAQKYAYENIFLFEPTDKSSNYQAVLNLLKQKQYKKARSKVTTLLIENPEDSNLYIFLGMIDVL